MKRSSVLVVALMLATPLAAAAADLRVLSSVAVKSAFDALIPRFEKASGHTIAIEYGTAAGIRKKIDAGEAFDVSVGLASATADLVKAGIVLPEPHPVVGVAVASLAYRTGAPKPEIATPEALKAVLLAASSISLSDPALGGASSNYFIAVTKQLGIADEIAPKLRPGKPGDGAVPVASGAAQYGAALTSEIAGVAGVSGVPIFPADPRSTTTLVATICAKSVHKDAARDFIDFLLTPDSVAVRKANGLAQE